MQSFNLKPSSRKYLDPNYFELAAETDTFYGLSFHKELSLEDLVVYFIGGDIDYEYEEGDLAIEQVRSCDDVLEKIKDLIKWIKSGDHFIMKRQLTDRDYDRVVIFAKREILESEKRISKIYERLERNEQLSDNEYTDSILFNETMVKIKKRMTKSARF